MLRTFERLKTSLSKRLKYEQVQRSRESDSLLDRGSATTRNPDVMYRWF